MSTTTIGIVIIYHPIEKLDQNLSNIYPNVYYQAFNYYSTYLSYCYLKYFWLEDYLVSSVESYYLSPKMLYTKLLICDKFFTELRGL